MSGWPGSTMKAFVIAAALRDGIVKPNTKFYCEKGSFKIGNRTIREAESSERFEDLTVSEILAVSSNVGTTKIAFKMGSEHLRQGLLDFGFGQKAGVDLPDVIRVFGFEMYRRCRCKQLVWVQCVFTQSPRQRGF